MAIGSSLKLKRHESNQVKEVHEKWMRVIFYRNRRWKGPTTGLDSAGALLYRSQVKILVTSTKNTKCIGCLRQFQKSLHLSSYSIRIECLRKPLLKSLLNVVVGICIFLVVLAKNTIRNSNFMEGEIGEWKWKQRQTHYGPGGHQRWSNHGHSLGSLIKWGIMPASE